MIDIKKFAAAAAALTVGALPACVSAAALRTSSAASSLYTDVTEGDIKYRQYSDHVVVTGPAKSGLTSVTIPSQINGINVTEIGQRAFSASTALESVSIPDTVTSINNYAFDRCRSLREISIPGSVSSIGSEAFRSCYSLASVTLPASLSSLGTGAFMGCSALTDINTAAGSQAFSSSEGVLFSADGSTLAAYPPGRTSSSYTVPDSVAAISPAAFADCDNLVSVYIPDSVTDFGGGRFVDCAALSSVRLPETLTVLDYVYTYNYTSDPMGFFEGCTSLSQPVLPGSLTEIGIDAFSGCTAMTSFTVPDSVRIIGSEAFGNNSSLLSVTVGSGTESLIPDAFDGSLALTDVFVSPDNDYFCDKDGILFTADCLTLVKYPGGRAGSSYTVPDGVRFIGYSAFYAQSFLESVTLPGSVTNIGPYAFNGCSALTELNFSDPESVNDLNIGRYAFYGSLYQKNCTDENGFSITPHGILLAVPQTQMDTMDIPASVKVAAGASVSNIYVKTINFLGDINLNTQSLYWCTELTAVNVAGDLFFGTDAVYVGRSKLTDLHADGNIFAASYIPNSIVNITHGRRLIEYSISDNSEGKPYYADAGVRKAGCDIVQSSSWYRYIDSFFDMQSSDGSPYMAAAVTDGAVILSMDSGQVFSVTKKNFTLGAACMDGQDNVYLLWGMSIPDSDVENNMDTCNIIVEKYSLSGDLIYAAAFPLSATESQSPFYAGNANMAVSNGVLGVLYDTEWILASDGYHHQGSVFIAIDSASMAPISLDTLNVSHSFGVCMIPTRNGFADIQNGDANYRGINLCFYNTASDIHYRVVGFHSPGQYGTNSAKADGNETYLELGGIAEGDSTYAVSGWGEKNYTSDVFSSSPLRTGRYDVFVRIVDTTLRASAAADCAGVERIDQATGNSADSNVIWLTSVAENESVQNVKTVTLGSGAYCVLWEQFVDEEFDSVKYVILDQQGYVLRQETELRNARLSIGSAQPLVNGSVLTWSVADADSDTVTWYTFDVGAQPDNIPGDADLSGDVKMNDAVLIMQAIANKDVYGVEGSDKNHITEKGEENGDVYERGKGLSTMDALSVQKLLLEQLSALPESYAIR